MRSLLSYHNELLSSDVSALHRPNGGIAKISLALSLSLVVPPNTKQNRHLIKASSCLSFHVHSYYLVFLVTIQDARNCSHTSWPMRVSLEFFVVVSVRHSDFVNDKIQSAKQQQQLRFTKIFFSISPLSRSFSNQIGAKFWEVRTCTNCWAVLLFGGRMECNDRRATSGTRKGNPACHILYGIHRTVAAFREFIDFMSALFRSAICFLVVCTLVSR